MVFSEPFPSYALTSTCCKDHNGLALTMWLKLKQFPAKLVSFAKFKDADPVIVLRILTHGDIKFHFHGHNARLV